MVKPKIKSRERSQQKAKATPQKVLRKSLRGDIIVLGLCGLIGLGCLWQLAYGNKSWHLKQEVSVISNDGHEVAFDPSTYYNASDKIDLKYQYHQASPEALVLQLNAEEAELLLEGHRYFLYVSINRSGQDHILSVMEVPMETKQ